MIITWTNDIDQDKHITGSALNASMRVSIDKSTRDESTAGVVCVLSNEQRQHEVTVSASVARAASVLLRVHLGGITHPSVGLQALNHSTPFCYDRAQRPFALDLDSFIDCARRIADQDAELFHPQFERCAVDVE